MCSICHILSFNLKVQLVLHMLHFVFCITVFVVSYQVVLVV